MGGPTALNDVPVARLKVSDRLPRFYGSRAGKPNQRTGNSRKLATLGATVRPRIQSKARYCSSGPLTNYERMVRLQGRILDSQGNYTAV